MWVSARRSSFSAFLALRRPGGAGLVRPAARLPGGWRGELTALLSVCPQQEGLDDGPDFLSEEERGVSVRAGAVAVFVSAPVLLGDLNRLTRPPPVELPGAGPAGETPPARGR